MLEVAASACGVCAADLTGNIHYFCIFSFRVLFWPNKTDQGVCVCVCACVRVCVCMELASLLWLVTKLVLS